MQRELTAEEGKALFEQLQAVWNYVPAELLPTYDGIVHNLRKMVRHDGLDVTDAMEVSIQSRRLGKGLSPAGVEEMNTLIDMVGSLVKIDPVGTLNVFDRFTAA